MTFLVAPVDKVPDEMSLSAMIGDTFIFTHKPMNGNAEYTPFWKQIVIYYICLKYPFFSNIYNYMLYGDGG